jgi:hypothetical protein
MSNATIPTMPQIFFRARRAGSREYGAPGSRYVEDFRHKWIAGAGAPDEPLVGQRGYPITSRLGEQF